MEKVVFIVESRTHSTLLLQVYLERAGYRVFTFFSVSEIKLYLKLKPVVIIYNINDESSPEEFVPAILSTGSGELSTLEISADTLKIRSYKSSMEDLIECTVPVDTFYTQIVNLLNKDVNSKADCAQLNYSS